MNDEEKKVLELLRMANELMGCILDDKQANIILNLIEKLQKENERYKKTFDNREYTWKQKYEETFGYVKELVKELKEDNSHQWEERCRLTFELKKLQKENIELKKDISNMYNKEVVISIICDNFDVTRLEALEMLGEEE